MKRREYLVITGAIGVSGCIAGGESGSESSPLREIKIQNTNIPPFPDLEYEINLVEDTITSSSTGMLEVSVTNITEDSVVVEAGGDRFPFQGWSSKTAKWLLLSKDMDAKRRSEECAQLDEDQDRFGYPFGWNENTLSPGQTESVQLELLASSEDWPFDENDSCMPTGNHRFRSSHRMEGREGDVEIELSIYN